MENVIETKSFEFAVRIVNLNKYLTDEKKEYTLSKQIMRSGTSIGANVSEAQNAQSKADFISKLNIALKEATETDYWLRLLQRTGYINQSQFQSLFDDCKEIERILVAIIKSAKDKESKTR